MNYDEKITKEQLEILSKEQIITHFLGLQDLFFSAREILEEVKEFGTKLLNKDK